MLASEWSGVRMAIVSARKPRVVAKIAARINRADRGIFNAKTQRGKDAKGYFRKNDLTLFLFLRVFAPLRLCVKTSPPMVQLLDFRLHLAREAYPMDPIAFLQP